MKGVRRTESKTEPTYLPPHITSDGTDSLSVCGLKTVFLPYVQGGGLSGVERAMLLFKREALCLRSLLYGSSAPLFFFVFLVFSAGVLLLFVLGDSDYRFVSGIASRCVRPHRALYVWVGWVLFVRRAWCFYGTLWQGDVDCAVPGCRIGLSLCGLRELLRMLLAAMVFQAAAWL